MTGDNIVERDKNSSATLGFTVVEMLVTLILFTISLALASAAFSGYQTRTAAQRAAQVFAMDLSVARAAAVRGRMAVVVSFDEVQGTYVVREESGDTIIKREFGREDEIPLDSVNLQMTGDSVVFDARGVGDLSGSASPLGTASFAAGAMVYDVLFNVMGASKVDAR